MRLDQRASCRIVLNLIKMMLAVDFDGKAEVVAAEVGDEARNWRLPSEFQTIKPAPAKLPPKQVLGRRAFANEDAGRFGSDGSTSNKVCDGSPKNAIPQPLRLRGHAFPIGEGK